MEHSPGDTDPLRGGPSVELDPNGVATGRGPDGLITCNRDGRDDHDVAVAFDSDYPQEFVDTPLFTCARASQDAPPIPRIAPGVDTGQERRA